MIDLSVAFSVPEVEPESATDKMILTRLSLCLLHCYTLLGLASMPPPWQPGVVVAEVPSVPHAGKPAAANATVSRVDSESARRSAPSMKRESSSAERSEKASIRRWMSESSRGSGSRRSKQQQVYDESEFKEFLEDDLDRTAVMEKLKDNIKKLKGVSSRQGDGCASSSDLNIKVSGSLRLSLMLKSLSDRPD